MRWRGFGLRHPDTAVAAARFGGQDLLTRLELCLQIPLVSDPDQHAG